MTIRTVASNLCVVAGRRVPRLPRRGRLAGRLQRDRRHAIYEKPSAPRPGTEPPDLRPKTGPRRNEAVRIAVLRATDDLLVDHGFHALTVSAIAERADAAKQTIYRWWRSKVDILLDVLEEGLKDGASEPLRAESASAALEQHVTGFHDGPANGPRIRQAPGRRSAGSPALLATGQRGLVPGPSR
ncbi:helix-turn-helix domain-containing protein [Streptomyces sp. LHD-70]|uniref:TetR/AcrR family transcriptional regulator n=1 Tax=Streptomyces sp. LHD-70 TaxID=3072140 RepID=UPI00280D50A0|nr:helix-turn-helix domain-containing protein [Streptomyces sp. LHD-70]MDQ8708134.1 helix-turn-helix domain-containing protein [Streptomyces sp. LHD-70]